MSYTEAETLYKTIYNPQIQYLLPFFSVPKKEIHQITKHTTAEFLRCTGYSSRTPRDVVYGAKSMGGLGWNDMAIEQGLQNIARLIIGMHDEEILGTMTNVMLNQWKWSIGFDPFQHYELQTPHDESIWLRNIRIFMIEKGIQIKKTVEAYPL
jgi:hypothetical protein